MSSYDASRLASFTWRLSKYWTSNFTPAADAYLSRCSLSRRTRPAAREPPPEPRHRVLIVSKVLTTATNFTCVCSCCHFSGATGSTDRYIHTRFSGSAPHFIFLSWVQLAVVPWAYAKCNDTAGSNVIRWAVWASRLILTRCGKKCGVSVDLWAIKSRRTTTL